MLPRARPRLTIAATFSLPHACCVIPIDQTSTADFAPPYIAQNASSSSRFAPDIAKYSSIEREPSAARRSLQPALFS